MTLLEALKLHPYSTAKRLAELMDVSIPTVHRRISAARKNGVRIFSSLVVTGNTGPVPLQYVLEKKS